MQVKIVVAIMGFVLLGVVRISAQIPTYAEEALLITRIKPGGTARILGMGGVQNSLGGDISSAYYNPAGLGMYNRSELSITPAFSINSTSSTYLGNNASANSNKFIIPNVGIAFQSKDENMGLWGGTLGVSYNRINDFNNTFTYNGTNADNSIIDRFIEKANGDNTSQFDPSGYNYNTPTRLAYDNYLIGPETVKDPSFDPKKYFTDVTGIPFQKETVSNSGVGQQLSISYGANFNDKIFLGAGIGFAGFDYKSQTTYTEEFSTGPMSKMQLNETLNLSGTGVNATLGVIIRPVDGFQMGFSFATPTSYQITDNYNATMTSAWDSFPYQPGVILKDEKASTDIVTSDYNLSTPWRISGGITYFIQKHGFISADAEWLKYSSAEYSSSSGDDYSADNKEIKGLYKSVVNFRVGGEYRLDKYRIRAGYNLMPDPYQSPQNGVSNSITSFSTGGGYRTGKFYVDLAVVFSQGNKSYRPYVVNSNASPLVNLNNKATSIVVTVGFPF